MALAQMHSEISTTPTKDQAEFAATMCSRLCHDLISPVGAVANGLEILADETDPEMQKQVLELLQQSVSVTTAKLKFYRLAFGAPGGLEGSVDAREVHAAVADYMAQGKVELEWSIAQATLPKSSVKVVLIAILTLSEALVRGGSLTVTSSSESDITVRGTGSKIILDDEAREILERGPREVHSTSRYAPLLLFLSIAQSAGLAHHLDLEDDSATLAISKRL